MHCVAFTTPDVMAGHPTFAGVCKVGTEKARLSMLESFHTLCKCLSRSKMQSDCLNCHGEQERKAKVRLSNSGSCIAIGQKARHPAGISSMICNFMQVSSSKLGQQLRANKNLVQVGPFVSSKP
jgi:hypothetical protein